MGKTLSKETRFVKALKDSLREKGIGVKKKDLVKFFCFVDDKCPWLILTGPDIHPKTWHKVGQDINKMLAEGEIIPEQYLSMWGIIRDILKEENSQGIRLLALTREYLQSSRPQSPAEKTPSPCPSVIIDMGNTTEEQHQEKIIKRLSVAKDRPRHSASKVEKKMVQNKGIYPSLTIKQSSRHASRPDSEWFDPASEAELEEEVAHYEKEGYWPPTAYMAQEIVPQSSLRALRPPPYNPAARITDLPIPPPLASDLLQTKSALESQVLYKR